MQSPSKFLNGNNMMRFIKAFVFGLVGLFVMITLISLLITSNVHVSRAVAISNTNLNSVYQQTANLKNWQNWHPMFKSGVSKITFGDSSTGKIADCNILYNNKTTHLIITEADSSSVKFLLQADGENDIKNEINFTGLTTSNEITVEWRALTHLRWYPWEKFYAIFIDKITGPGYEDALNGLKNFIEKK